MKEKQIEFKIISVPFDRYEIRSDPNIHKFTHRRFKDKNETSSTLCGMNYADIQGSEVDWYDGRRLTDSGRRELGFEYCPICLEKTPLLDLLKTEL